MPTVDLPMYPSKGNRRTLDHSWLALLHREGLLPYLCGVKDLAWLKTRGLSQNVSMSPLTG